MIKKYNNFINEGIFDLISGYSMDEILDKVEKNNNLVFDYIRLYEYKFGELKNQDLFVKTMNNEFNLSNEINKKICGQLVSMILYDFTDGDGDNDNAEDIISILLNSKIIKTVEHRFIGGYIASILIYISIFMNDYTNIINMIKEFIVKNKINIQKFDDFDLGVYYIGLNILDEDISFVNDIITDDLIMDDDLFDYCIVFKRYDFFNKLLTSGYNLKISDMNRYDELLSVLNNNKTLIYNILENSNKISINLKGFIKFNTDIAKILKNNN